MTEILRFKKAYVSKWKSVSPADRGRSSEYQLTRFSIIKKKIIEKYFLLSEDLFLS